MKIRVEFEVSDDIAMGLSTGTMERVGGVIRYTDSKQVVAWLREGGNISRSSSSGLSLLPTLLKVAGMNARTIAVVAGAVAVAGPLLDLAIIGYTIHRLTQRIKSLKQEIADIYDRLEKLFNRSTDAALLAALDQAEDFLDAEDFVTKQGMLNNVIDRLVYAEKLLLKDFDDALTEGNLVLAGKLLTTVFTVNALSTRCRLDFGEEKVAINRLNKNLSGLESCVKALVRELVGDQPALYFHESVCEDYLDRYIQIRSWLDGSHNIWESVVKEARTNFWNDKAVKPLFQAKWKGLYQYQVLQDNPFYRESIPPAEELIENFQRFESYALDLESSERPSRDLEELSEDAARRLADHDDYVLLVDEDALDRAGRLSA